MDKQNETHLVVTITSCVRVNKSKKCILHLHNLRYLLNIIYE